MMHPGKPVHAPQTQFAVTDNCLQIGGVALTAVAAQVGSTPFYAYDRALISARVQSLRELLPKRVALHYSIKANPMPAVVEQLAALVDGLDVASAAEMQVALNTGIAPAHISFAGPGKTDAELSLAISAGVILNIESLNELHRLQKISRTLAVTPNVMVRVNPDFELKSSGMKMGGGARPFGIDAEMVPAVLDELAALDVDFLGFHIFSGSQSLKPEAIADAHANSIELAIRLAEHTSQTIRQINIGSGFGIPYFPGEQHLNLNLVAARLHDGLARLEQALPAANVSLEMGRYLVGEAGIYVSRVIDKKISRGQCYLVTDGGLHHHLAASGNFGQVIRKNYPVAVGNNMHGAHGALATVVGPLCTPLDVLADNMPLAHAEVGDLIVVFQSGAYGLTASPSAFLSHPAAREILL